MRIPNTRDHHGTSLPNKNHITGGSAIVTGLKFGVFLVNGLPPLKKCLTKFYFLSFVAHDMPHMKFR